MCCGASQCPVSDALKRIGQLWALGDFPPSLQPFVWSWPSGRDVTYFCAKRWCAEHAQMNADLTTFFASLSDAGYERVHVLTHSMGAMILLSALQHAPFTALFASADTPPPTHYATRGACGHIEACLAPATAPPMHATPPTKGTPTKGTPTAGTPTASPASSSPPSGGTLPSSASGPAPVGPPPVGPPPPPRRRLRLLTTTLMNPDTDLDRFVGVDYGRLRALCDHITVYADHSDRALWYSELFNRWRALGRRPFELHANELGTAVEAGGSPAERSPAERSPCGRSYSPCGRSYGLPPPRRQCTPTAGEEELTRARAPVGTPPVGTPPALPALPALPSRRRARGAPPRPPAGKFFVPLDVDVIECSWMDGNIHSMRHLFFNLNRHAVDDLREIFTTRNRARARTSRITHRFANVYSFLAAPSHVVNP